MSYPIHIVDVFTDRALAGNQLAVVLDADGITPDVMQRIAREMNFSETTFVLAPLRPEHAARVRIFTPGTELPHRMGACDGGSDSRWRTAVHAGRRGRSGGCAR